MGDWRLGLAVVAFLVLIPVIVVGRFVFAILSAWREGRIEEARRVIHLVPGFGEFTSTDGELWFGEMQDLQVSPTTAGQRPTESQGAELRRLLANLPGLVEHSRAFLLVHEDCSRLAGSAELFEPCGLEFEHSSLFTLEIAHPADVDGVYRVEFRSGLPVSSARDD
jgi:hypothetical protein